MKAEQELIEEEKRIKQLIQKNGNKDVQIAKYVPLDDDMLQERIL